MMRLLLGRERGAPPPVETLATTLPQDTLPPAAERPTHKVDRNLQQRLKRGPGSERVIVPWATEMSAAVTGVE